MKDKLNHFLFVLALSPLFPQRQGYYPHSVGVSQGANLLIVAQFERQVEYFHEGEGLMKARQKLDGAMIIRCLLCHLLTLPLHPTLPCGLRRMTLVLSLYQTRPEGLCYIITPKNVFFIIELALSP